jgi:alpha-1,2-mannosyltransferase
LHIAGKPNDMTSRRLLTNPYLRRALALWACLAVAVCVKTAYLGSHHSVYPQFAASSHHWWSDKSLYKDYRAEEGIDGYRYSPTFAVAFTPLAYLPERLAMMIWKVASIVLLVWALHVLVRDVAPGNWPPHREGVFSVLTLVGSAVGIWSGQSNALVIALLMLAMSAIVRQRWWTASILLAVPVFIKIWPAAFVLLLVVFWPRQLTWRLAVVCILLALAPFLTRPPSTVVWQYREWYAALTGPFQGRWGGYRDAWTIWEQLSSVNHRVYAAIQLTAALGVVGWCGWQYRRQTLLQQMLFRETPPDCNGGALGRGEHFPNRLLMLIFSMWASWQLFLGPGSEQLTYGIIAPSAAWAVVVSFAEKRARWLTVTAWAMLAILPSGDVEREVLKISHAAVILPPLGVVLFASWLIWHERGPHQETVRV